MFTQADYLWGWFYYVLGALILLAAWWYLTRRIPWRGARHILCILLAVTLLMPWYSDAQSTYLSPAWMVSAIETVMEGPQAFWRAGLPLVVTVTLALLVSLLFYTLLWWRTNHKTN